MQSGEQEVVGRNDVVAWIQGRSKTL